MKHLKTSRRLRGCWNQTKNSGKDPPRSEKPSCTKSGTVAGCLVLDGTMRVNTRSDCCAAQSFGKVSCYCVVKDDVREVEKGYECDQLDGFNDIKVGDQLEILMEEEGNLKSNGSSSLDRSHLSEQTIFNSISIDTSIY